MQAGIGIHIADCTLEAQVLRRQEAVTKTDSKLGVVVVHPHASLGGSMADPVVSTLLRAAARCPQVTAVLRYNQRGVGNSTGTASFRGGKSFMDIVDVCKYLLQLEDAPTRLLIIGYSYGACIAAHALQLEQVEAFVAVSPPLGFLANLALGTREHFMRVQRFGGPVKVMLGSADQFCSISTMQQLITNINQARVCERQRSGPTECGQELLELQVYDNCDHFWGGCLDDLAESTYKWTCKL